MYWLCSIPAPTANCLLQSEVEFCFIQHHVQEKKRKKKVVFDNKEIILDLADWKDNTEI